MSSDDLAAVCLGRIETMIRLDEGERRNLDVAELQAWSLALVAVRLDKAMRLGCLDVRTCDASQV